MLILRSVVDQQQEASRGQALDQPVEQGLGLGIHPVQVLKDQEQRLYLALMQQDACERFERALASLGWVKTQEWAVFWEGIQQRQQRRDGVLECRVERQHLPGDFGADGAGVIALFDVTVALEQVDDREVRRGLTIGDRGTLQHQPALGMIGVDTLVDQPRLAYPGFPNERDDLAMSGASPLPGPR